MNSKMKRALCALLAAVLLLPAFTLAAGDKPNPIPVKDRDAVTPSPEGVHHYLMVCIDQWGFDFKTLGSHTDGLILVTVDEFSGRIMLTSFIRDMLVKRWDDKYGRINNIFYYYQQDGLGLKHGDEDSARAGIEQLVNTIDTHFDLDIEKYIVVDFTQVQAIVDAIGGVEITLTSREAARLRSFGIDIPSGGTYNLPGYAAVIYMRIRKVYNEYTDAEGVVHHETQDAGRTRRARTVLTSIADRFADISEDEAWEVIDTVMDHTLITNVTGGDLFEILRLAMEMKGTPIEEMRMPIDGAYEEKPYAGMATVQLDWEKNVEALHEFLFDSGYAVR